MGETRTNVVLNDDLLARAMASTGLKTKRAVLEEGLRLLAAIHDQRAILDLAGKVHWDGDLAEMRKGRGQEW
jgi:Arc/MetJ family transcription regulator